MIVPAFLIAKAAVLIVASLAPPPKTSKERAVRQSQRAARHYKQQNQASFQSFQNAQNMQLQNFSPPPITVSSFGAGLGGC